MTGSAKDSGKQAELVRWFREPLDRLRENLLEAGCARDRVPSAMGLLDFLINNGLVDPEIGARYRAAYERLRYSGIMTPDVSEVRDALATNLPPAGDLRSLIEKQTETKPQSSEKRESVGEAPPAAISGGVPRKGWTRPPVVWDAPKDEARSERGEASQQGTRRRWNPVLVTSLVILFLVLWTGATAATTYSLRHKITATLWKIKYGRSFPISWRGHRAGRVENLLAEYTRKDFSEDERAELAKRIARQAYEEGDFLLAEHFYRVAIERQPADAELLNELAWMLLTKGEDWFQDPLQGYNLAWRAFQLKKEAPHIKDTLAEAYFLLGKYEEAVELEKQVLEEATSQQDFYRRQLKKFQQALDQSRERAAEGTR